MQYDRESPIAINKTEFKNAGYALIDKIASFIESINEKPVTKGESPQQIQDILGNYSLPENGIEPSILLAKASDLLLNHSLLNGHPKFLGYITSSAAPIGALADLLAASINPNVGANILSPMATAIEQQTIRWLAEFIGVAPTYGGLIVSGGNMANFTAFLAARTAMAQKSFKQDGLIKEDEMLMYCSKATHTWIEKAAVLFGHGTRSIRWIATNDDLTMNINALQQTLENDFNAGKKPFIVIGNAGDVSTGVVDDLKQIATVCKKFNLWFHIDGAYGIPAAVIPELKDLFAGIEEADSIALDPHKWLYSPLEAGCTLVKDPNHLIDTYSSHPIYYNFGNKDETFSQNFYEYGFQNSRGFKALKVWLALQQVGRNGYIQMINDDIKLSKLFFELADKHPQLEAITQNLSITTLRYVPEGVEINKNGDYLNTLNETLLNTLQTGGKAFLSNAVVNDKYCLRACIVNFRTSARDIQEIIAIIVKEGEEIHKQLDKK